MGREQPVEVHWHISPTADQHLASGIRNGVEQFLRDKLDLTPSHVENDYSDVRELEDEALFHETSVHFGRFMHLLRRNKEIHEPKEASPHWDIVITDRELVFDDLSDGFGNLDLWTKRVANAVYSTHPLEQETERELRTPRLKERRGQVLGYGMLATRLHIPSCTNMHCAFRIDNREDINTLALLLAMNEQMPLCDMHKNWKAGKVPPTFS
jgi:hypothetical protein